MTSGPIQEPNKLADIQITGHQAWFTQEPMHAYISWSTKPHAFHFCWQAHRVLEPMIASNAYTLILSLHDHVNISDVLNVKRFFNVLFIYVSHFLFVIGSFLLCNFVRNDKNMINLSINHLSSMYTYTKSWRTCGCFHVFNGPASYVKFGVAHAPGMPETCFLPSRFSDPDMPHGTCVMQVPWCMLGSNLRFHLKSVVGETLPAFPAHAQPRIYVSGKRPITTFHHSCSMSPEFQRFHVYNTEVLRSGDCRGKVQLGCGKRGAWRAPTTIRHSTYLLSQLLIGGYIANPIILEDTKYD